MLSLYNPATGATIVSNGQTSPEIILVNILIELRAMNEILLGNAGSNSAASLRNDAVNETNNAAI